MNNKELSYEFKMPLRYVSDNLWDLFKRVGEKKGVEVKISDSDSILYSNYFSDFERENYSKYLSFKYNGNRYNLSKINNDLALLLKESDLGHIYYIDDSINPLTPELDLYELGLKIDLDSGLYGLINKLVHNNFKLFPFPTENYILFSGIEFEDVGMVNKILDKYYKRDGFEYIEFDKSFEYSNQKQFLDIFYGD